jgi:hypothetical protein
MSNWLAIATVTAALAQTVRTAVQEAVPGADVVTGRPDAAPGTGTAQRRAHLFLYQVAPNTALSNADLPMRGSDGRLAQRPRAALDLDYLLAFYGDEAQLEPQRMLGAVVRDLHAHPVLTRKAVADAARSQPFLANSNLAEALELVRFTPVPLTLEELSKLWSVFFQTPYALTVTYRGTVVLIDAEETAPAPLPVRERVIQVRPFRHPMIEAVQSADGPHAPIVAGGTLVISGKYLRADEVQVRIGAELVPAADVTDASVTLPLTSPPIPATALRAGAQAVQLVQPMMLGRPPRPHAGVESNAAAFVLRPKITPQQASRESVTLGISPPVAPAQRVVLLLNERIEDAPLAYSFPAPLRDKDSGTVTIPITGVKAPASYWVRVQIDGAESVLDTEPASATFGPEVRIA